MGYIIEKVFHKVLWVLYVQTVFSDGEFHFEADYCKVIRYIKYCFYMYIIGSEKWYFNKFYNSKTNV